MKYNEERHEYKENGIIIPSVTQILKGAGLIDLSFINKDLLAEKADFGTKVHETTELYDKFELDTETLHPTLNNYLKQWVKFQNDFKIQIQEIETMYYHPSYRFAGRLDRIISIGKDFAIVDIKTGGKFPSYPIQTAAYKMLYETNHKEKIKKRFTVYLTENSYKVDEHKNKTDESVFLAALTIYNYKKGNK